jgi:hypothetical protein
MSSKKDFDPTLRKTKSLTDLNESELNAFARAWNESTPPVIIDDPSKPMTVSKSGKPLLKPGIYELELVRATLETSRQKREYILTKFEAIDPLYNRQFVWHNFYSNEPKSAHCQAFRGLDKTLQLLLALNEKNQFEVMDLNGLIGLRCSAELSLFRDPIHTDENRILRIFSANRAPLPPEDPSPAPAE